MANQNTADAGRSWVAEGAAWVLVLTGIVLAIAAGRETASLFAAGQSWVPAEATVIRTQVREVRHRAPLSLRETTAGFQVFQDLVYFRKGSRYQESVSLGVFSSESEAANRARAAAQPGTTLTILIDAANPVQIRLDEGHSNATWRRTPQSSMSVVPGV